MFGIVGEMGKKDLVELYRLVQKDTGEFFLADDLTREVFADEDHSFLISLQSKYALDFSELERRIRKKLSNLEGDYGYEFSKGNLDSSKSFEYGKHLNCSVRVYPIQFHGYFPQDLPFEKPKPLDCASFEKMCVNDLQRLKNLEKLTG